MTPEGKKEVRQAIADVVHEAVAIAIAAAYEDAAKIAETVASPFETHPHLGADIAAAIREKGKQE